MINSHPDQGMRFTLRTLFAVICVILITACGGGLSGSGDGGSDRDPGPTTVLPPSLDRVPYRLRYLPDKLLADIPGSLSLAHADDFLENSPYSRLNRAVGLMVDRKLEIALLQLAVDANWDSILEHCSTTPVDAECDISGANITTVYSAEMASWEYLVRYAIAQESTGQLQLVDQSAAAIEAQVLEKIGTTLAVDSGRVIKRSGGAYAYEFLVSFDVGFGLTTYTLRWSADSRLGFISAATLSPSLANSLQAFSSESGDEFVNNVLMTAFDENEREEIQLNLKRPGLTSELQIEAQLTDIETATKTDFYSIGLATSQGGYLTSEKVVKQSDDEAARSFVREGFNDSAAVESSAVCIDKETEAQCTQTDSWQVLLGDDPIVWQFFLEGEQLRQLEATLTPFDITLTNVAPDIDTFVLIRRENLSISFGPTGLIVNIPGLGEINLSDPSANQFDGDESLITDYAGQRVVQGQPGFSRPVT